MPLIASHYSLLGGEVCLNFTNTCRRSEIEKPYEFFGSYPALLQWALQLGLLAPWQAEAQFELAARQPSGAQSALEDALRLREALYAAFSALAGGQTVPGEALGLINAAWADAMRHLKVTPEGQKFSWKWDGMESTLTGALWPVAKSAAELLVSEKLPRVKSCGGCGWLFLDTTRDGRRRWCDMKLCGNRAKVRRHYEKVRPLA